MVQDHPHGHPSFQWRRFVSKDTFREVTTIRTPSGLVGTVTERIYNGRETYSFSVRKEYDRDGETKHTTWLQKQHFNELRKLIDDLEDAIAGAEDKSRERLRRTPMGQNTPGR